MSLASPLDWTRGDDEIRRWSLCFAVVLGLHVVPVLILAWWLGPVVSVVTPSPSAIMVDMAPLPASPPAPRPEIPPGLRRQRVQIPRPPVKQPKLPTVARAAVFLPTEQASPQHPEDKIPAQQTSAPPAVLTKPAPASAAASSAALPPSNATPTWQGLVLGRLEQFKRYPALAQSRGQQGIVWLHFTMDRDGKVLAAKIDKSSGYDLLDAETLALIQRAQPLPKPPPEVPGATIELETPIEFFLTAR